MPYDVKAVVATIKRKPLAAAAALGAVGYIGYRWWASRAAGGAGVAAPATADVGPGVDSSGVVGAGYAGGNMQYATAPPTDATGEHKPGNFSTNAEWTAYAVDHLAGTGGWGAAAVMSALGDYLDRRPLSDAEQAIVRSAVAMAGAPPVGGPYTVINQVGPVTLTAPTGLHVTAVTRNTVTLAWSPVPGAGYYRAYRKGVATNIGGSDNPTITVGGLAPATRYEFWVAADTTTSKPGPPSAHVTATTAK
jgi:hypothetical protein